MRRWGEVERGGAGAVGEACRGRPIGMELARGGGRNAEAQLRGGAIRAFTPCLSRCRRAFDVLSGHSPWGC